MSKLPTTRYVLAVDFEATCDDDRTKIPRHESEIIEFGAVMIDTETGKTVFEFTHFVKPVIHPTLSAFCTKLTTITQDQVDSGVTFGVACELLDVEIARSLGNAEFSWISWGQYDYNQFHAQVKRDKPSCDNVMADAPHFNLKEIESQLAGRKPIGLDGAVKTHGLKWHGVHHRGIDDAINVGNILMKLLKEQNEKA